MIVAIEFEVSFPDSGLLYERVGRVKYFLYKVRQIRKEIRVFICGYSLRIRLLRGKRISRYKFQEVILLAEWPLYSPMTIVMLTLCNVWNSLKMFCIRWNYCCVVKYFLRRDSINHFAVKLIKTRKSGTDEGSGSVQTAGKMFQVNTNSPASAIKAAVGRRAKKRSPVGCWHRSRTNILLD